MDATLLVLPLLSVENERTSSATCSSESSSGSIAQTEGGRHADQARERVSGVSPALGSIFAFASLFNEGNPKQVGQFFRHRNHVTSDFGPSEMIDMFLIKTPSPSFSSSRSRVSRHVLAAGGRVA
ncbi:hypothetical protein [Reticulibacter mediterranei]|uniref:hypothetical protein n=1 Tax=Reticulibacter mediterranei TaxID=2778369 RepID=UPI001C693955|nr:hypothetical protein [Reticulibacter mediterranei]